MIRHAARLARNPLFRDVLSWLWQVLVVLILSLSLIWMGTRLPSEQRSDVVPELVQQYVCISDADGILRQCRLSVLVPPSI